MYNCIKKLIKKSFIDPEHRPEVQKPLLQDYYTVI